MASQSAARKAWNDAMKATAGANALPPSLQMQGHKKRRSDRHKKQERRTKARKAVLHAIDGDDDHEAAAYRAALWVDALEGIDPSSTTTDDDEEYDELGDLEEGNGGSGGGGTRKRRRSSASGSSSTKAAGGGGGKSSKKAGVLPKRFLPRTLASILMEDANREDGGASRAFLGAEARVNKSTRPPPPKRKFCPVTGLEGIYTEPKSGIPYATMRALEQIRERPPPWMTLGGAGAYWEAMKSIEEE